tara:strand:+ start:7176 stop:8219 length:1044 start_codon:yes stop_codon:yes gene_type:complete
MITLPLRILKRKIFNFKRYQGNHIEICNQIIKDRYQNYFQTGSHFKDFYIRDFSWCIKPLINQGYQKEVTKTLNWVLKKFRNKPTTTITPLGFPINFFSQAADSLPSLVKCLKINNQINKEFIEQQTTKYLNLIDDSGLIKEDLNLSSIKDHYKRKSSMYDNCQVALLSNLLTELKLNNPLKEYNYKKILKQTYWNGSYFEEDKVSKELSSEANIFPYYLEIFQEKEMLKSSINSIQQQDLEKPFPLKYTLKRNKKQELLIAKLIPNYEGNSIWSHLGLIYIDILNKIDKEQAIKHLNKYKELIETHKTFLEVYNTKGEPFSTLLYKTDEAMIWAAKYLNLTKQINL